MGHIAAIAVACRESPAVGAIALVMLRVLDAVLAIDERVVAVLFPVIGMPVLQSVGINPHEAIVGKEQRAAIVESQRQLHAIVGLVVDVGSTVHQQLL